DSSVHGVADVMVSPGAMHHFGISAPASAVAGEGFDLVVVAQDEFGNTITDYTGTIHFNTWDGALPANYTFSAADQGMHTFHATLQTAGQQAIRVADVNDSSVHGVANVMVEAPVAVPSFDIQAPANATPGQPVYITVVAKDADGNVM